MTIDTSGGHHEMDYREHVRTYQGFVRGTMILTAITIVILAGMAFFLV